ncbi:hypothetical protein Kpol_312p10 [Vanderwaltozyma polyspora DSM 70294]|uniref:Golgi apyrase n=1 Tax=Vanderwaltozyma polyspora (strain ATCC 22028 / DSM 70294 / BCRC 21397 / CBS 2163 / NBRC 10782 / NRRL Y-8283 / UCD 57-17) TaxID=436907 RepID=A7TSJ3_VANPO|nr:uncharacterized protein Kpol_312p10 [Vanderwaltozyma polyspora DSM 70294]EDO14771.1 hypothetical protein Kpol_312p10 [Vanderwaltozyma polyspora DSM 70294]
MSSSLENSDSYGIVIDAGSSGSRIHIYKWSLSVPNEDNTANEGGIKLSHSVPQIYQDDEWTSKTTPGLSTYEMKPDKAFSKHVKPLLKFAEKYIPKDKLKETPVFLQATAGMRLLPVDRQKKILQNICKGIKQSTGFLMEDCNSQIQVIDGETEGLYGWLSLNYLSGYFNNFDASSPSHFTLGFMDMGGASTQIAFSPSDKEQVKKHSDDISNVYLRSINGDIQQWDVFVSTWLGFGANQARKRYFSQLINSLPENTNDYDDDDFVTRKISDPCMPKGSETKFEFKGKKFTLTGSGDNEQCSKLIYPLLLKNLPCNDDPCLFNGVHAPQIDYYNDKFVGVSEYWYTANDVFKLGGEYDFYQFSTKVKEFCNTDWDIIKKNSKDGMYNSIPDSFLMDSCFKANWVLNVLYEGFGLPRIDVDELKDTSANANYPLFQSADKINNREVSWTLGKILLYASGTILAGDQSINVGVEPSSNSAINFGSKFIMGGLKRIDNRSSHSLGVLRFFFIIMTIFIVWYLVLSKSQTFKDISIKMEFLGLIEKIKFKLSRHQYYNELSNKLSKLEEGINVEEDISYNLDSNNDVKLRSKSMFNLNTDNHSRSGSNRPHGKSPLASKGNNISNSPLSLTSSDPTKLRPTFSLADFSKYKDGKSTD